MTKRTLPKILLRAKPAGLKFKSPDSALARWDKTIAMKAAPAAHEIDILGEIGFPEYGGTSAEMVKRALKAIGKAPVTVYLNSPGGDAFEGIAIYNLLREHPGDVTVRVLGMAASAASIIAMAGERIEIGEAATMMIHSSSGLVIGNEADMREFAEVLAALDQAVAEVYARRSGGKVADILLMMKKETWMFSREAIDKGFADTSFKDEDEAAPKRATSDKKFFARVPIEALLAASGDRQRAAVRLSATLPGASGSAVNPTRGNMKTIKQQIADFEAKRSANAARMEAIMTASGESGATLDESQEQEYDGLQVENATVDKHLVRLRAHEASIVASATAVDAAAVNADAAAAAAARGGSQVISVKSNVPKGAGFTRYVMAMARSRGNLPGALAIAQNNQQWKRETPDVERVLMAAVAGGDTTTAGWASELVYNENLVSEFMELLRPQTILGKMSGLRRVPFNVRMSGVDSGSSAYWVGQGKPVPVSKLHTLEVTLGIAKAAGLVVLTEELVKSSSPSAELVVRDDLTKSISQFLDVQFVDPNVAAVANVSPASITNGVTPLVPTGTTQAALRADVQTLFAAWINDNLDPSGAVWIMSPITALAISLMQNPLGQPTFPGITMDGGVFFGIPVIVSNSANIPGSPDSGRMIILAKASDILFADDGGITIDASREASIEMLDNPTNASTPTVTATSMVSMFQTNSVAIKVVRFVNWKKRRTNAVQYIREAAYVS